MNVPSAVVLLGLGEGALTRDRVRRAYMRKLRAHPPERDPDGFRRLREAYELVLRYAVDDEPSADEVLLAESAAPPPTAAVEAIEAKVIDASAAAAAGVAAVLGAPAVVTVPVAPPLVVTLPIAAPLVVTVPIAPPPPVPPAPPQPVPPSAPLPRIASADRVEAPRPLTVIVPKLLELLAAGHVDTAIELERDWRTAHDADDVRESNALVAARWALARELLLAAPKLPLPVLQALAKAILAGDLRTARPALSQFRGAKPVEAARANGVLVTLAPSLMRELDGTLTVYEPAPTPRIVERKSSGYGPLSGVAIVVLAIARFATTMHSSSSSSYEPPSRLPYELQHYQYQAPPDFSAATPTWQPPPTPSPLAPKASKLQLTTEIVQSADIIAQYDISSPEQKAAAEALATAGRSDAPTHCIAMRKAFSTLQVAPLDMTDSRRTLYALEHVEAIEHRIDLACPPRATKKSAPKRPAAPPTADPAPPAEQPPP